MSTGTWPGPVRHFLAEVDELRSGGDLDMDKVGQLLTGLAADEEFFAPLIAQMPSESMGVHWLAQPDRGPRLVLVHRPAGVMAYTHSHRCWVGIAPVRGVETHQRWHAVRHEDGRAELSLADERVMRRGDVATLIPPDDVHNHGHVLGTGPSPYSIILLGDDMLRFEREEYDPERRTWQRLAPGDPGRENRSAAGRRAYRSGCAPGLRARMARLTGIGRSPGSATCSMTSPALTKALSSSASGCWRIPTRLRT